MATLKIGSRHTLTVSTFKEASDLYCTLRDASGEGGSTWPDGRLSKDGKRYRISYNGKVWEGSKYVPGAVPVFNPYD